MTSACVSGDDRMFWSRLALDRTPLRPTLIAPAAGQQGVALRPQLRWSDPGAGTVRAAESYLMIVTRKDHPAFDAWFLGGYEEVTTPSHTLGVDLPASTDCLWQITPFVANGTPDQVKGPPAEGSFSTAAVQAQQPPQSPSTPPPSPPRRATCSAELDTAAPFSQVSTAMRISGYGFDVREEVEIVGQSGHLTKTLATPPFGMYGVSIGFLKTTSSPTTYKVFARGLTSGLTSNEAAFTV